MKSQQSQRKRTQTMIRYTAKGQKYVERDELHHFVSGSHKISLASANAESLELHYGAGIRLYFTYMKFAIVWNALLAIAGIVSWAAASKKNSSEGWSALFVSSYADSTVWLPTNSILFAGWWLFGFLYWSWEKFIFVDAPVAVIHLSPPDSDVIQENVDQSSRHYLGIFCTLGALIIAGAVFYGLLVAQRLVGTETNTSASGTSETSETINIAMGIPLSLSFVICTAIWDTLSYTVTECERCKTWGAFRMSQAVKLIGFKIFASMVMYVLIPFVLVTPQSANCIIESAGTNFFVIVMIDTFLVMIFVNSLLPVIIRRGVRHFFGKEMALPEFNVSDHLLQLIYRQFIIYVGFIVFPLIGVLGLFAICLQYFVDKVQLLHLCQDTHYVREHPGIFLLGFSLFAAATATVAYPNGALWMLYLPHLLPLDLQNCTVF